MKWLKEAVPNRMTGAELKRKLSAMHSEITAMSTTVPLEIINPWAQEVVESIDSMVELLKGMKSDMGL